MSFLIVKSIPLSTETRQAWKQQGATFLRRSRNALVPEVFEVSFDFILNLGNVDLVSHGLVPVFNAPDTIRSISTATALRRTLDDFIPPRILDGPHWHKKNGFGGKGKVFHDHMLGECVIPLGDVQQHIDGQEYRVITVGDKVIQAFEKHGTFPEFEWNWIGVQGIKSNGIIPLIKDAITFIPESQHSFLGWDIIVSDQGPFVIEINTSPGVNEHTAQRTIEQIRKEL